MVSVSDGDTAQLKRGWSAADALALRCAVSSCKRQTTVAYITLPSATTNIDNQLLIAVSITEMCLYVVYGTRRVSDLWQRTHSRQWSRVQAYLHCGLDYCNAILAGTVDTAMKRLQSVNNTAARLISGTIFRDHYHYSTEPPLAFGIAQNRFQEHKKYELCMPVKNFRGRPWLRASIVGYIQ